MLASIALVAGLFIFGSAGGTFLPVGVARADVIDEYTEPPPPTPEPTPNPSPSDGGKPSNAGGGSGSQADSGVSYSYDTSSTASAPAAPNAAKSKKSEKTVAPRASAAAAIALEPAAADSTFLSAAFGGVGWLLPTLLILIAVGAAVWTRLNRPKVRSSRVPRARP